MGGWIGKYAGPVLTHHHALDLRQAVTLGDQLAQDAVLLIGLVGARLVERLVTEGAHEVLLHLGEGEMAGSDGERGSGAADERDERREQRRGERPSSHVCARTIGISV